MRYDITIFKDLDEVAELTIYDDGEHFLRNELRDEDLITIEDQLDDALEAGFWLGKNYASIVEAVKSADKAYEELGVAEIDFSDGWSIEAEQVDND